MYASLLLATILAVPAQHLPARQVALAVVAGREAPQKVGEGTMGLYGYCDARNQPTIMMTNAGSSAYVVEWTLTAIKPGYPPDRWSSVSRVEPGQFEGWMSPAPCLHLDVLYDDDGFPTANSIDASCPATARWESGLEE